MIINPAPFDSEWRAGTKHFGTRIPFTITMAKNKSRKTKLIKHYSNVDFHKSPSPDLIWSLAQPLRGLKSSCRSQETRSTICSESIEQSSCYRVSFLFFCLFVGLITLNCGHKLRQCTPNITILGKYWLKAF